MQPPCCWFFSSLSQFGRTQPLFTLFRSFPGCSSLGRAWECTKDCIGCHKKIYSPNSPSGDSVGAGRVANRAWAPYLWIPPRVGPAEELRQPPFGGKSMPRVARNCRAPPNAEKAGERAQPGLSHPALSRLGRSPALVRDWSGHRPGVCTQPRCLGGGDGGGSGIVSNSPPCSGRRQAGRPAPPLGRAPGRSVGRASTQIRGKTGPSSFAGPAGTAGSSQLSFHRLFYSAAVPQDRQAWAVRASRDPTAWIWGGRVLQAPWLLTSTERQSRGCFAAVAFLWPWRKRALGLGHAKIRNMHAQNRDFARGCSPVT